jgi:hypothetical protein
MNCKSPWLSILLTALIASTATYFYMKMQKGTGRCDGVSEKGCLLRRTMAKLWSDHVFWTRLYIISALDNAPDKEAATDRLLKNQQDIGDAVASYYGKEAGEQLAKILKEHILIAGDVVDAAKTGDDEKLKEADARWHQNADEIAQFLNKANPTNWDEKEMRDMFYKHLKVTTAEVTYRLKKDWNADVKNFDVVYDQALDMGQSLSNGILAQFPSKF